MVAVSERCGKDVGGEGLCRVEHKGRGGGSERAGSKSNGIIMGSRVEGFNFGNGCASSVRLVRETLAEILAGRRDHEGILEAKNLRVSTGNRFFFFFFFFFDRLGSEFSLISKEMKEMEQQEVFGIIIIGLKWDKDKDFHPDRQEAALYIPLRISNENFTN